ncbi:hypothetical protein N658DRAFT_343179 [Parathielavia hyrcaniae]|uniref:Uncharacterized protein n=1 Tax=Parathielavia hyrcaniae TaxID=113614 RepID=A0AAN6Q2Y7_9PEZI|nr:hypothetical protein N658DRAFT_343179 [Parathielavia hyrcaniae]
MDHGTQCAKHPAGSGIFSEAGRGSGDQPLPVSVCQMETRGIAGRNPKALHPYFMRVCTCSVISLTRPLILLRSPVREHSSARLPKRITLIWQDTVQVVLWYEFQGSRIPGSRDLERRYSSTCEQWPSHKECHSNQEILALPPAFVMRLNAGCYCATQQAQSSARHVCWLPTVISLSKARVLNVSGRRWMNG